MEDKFSCCTFVKNGYWIDVETELWIRHHASLFDEVVVAMNKVAHQIPRELKCTNLGGLSTTPTADKIAAKLAGKSCDCVSSCGS